MKIETTLDKLVISPEEVQKIIKAYILVETNRVVSEHVNFQLSNDNNYTATAWCRLLPGEVK